MAWVRRNLRGTPVWARARADGMLDVGSDGKVDVKYKLDEDARIYRANPKNLEAAAGAPVPPQPDVETHPTKHDARAIVIYTDGACTGNPGPMGIGVVMLRDGERKELSEYLGHGTHNIAELTAIGRALELVPAADRGRDVLVHSDSSYAIGLLASGWKAKANQELVAQLRKQVALFPRIRFVKVAGHAGVPENERCDQLATGAIKERSG
jgi:ribonuclease HI